MHNKQRIILVLLAIILVLSGAGYLVYRNSAPDNYPYEPDTPAPDPHDGMFVSVHGSMAFNGDGESVTINFDEELADLLGLPSGEQSGKYVEHHASSCEGGELIIITAAPEGEITERRNERADQHLNNGGGKLFLIHHWKSSSFLIEGSRL